MKKPSEPTNKGGFVPTGEKVAHLVSIVANPLYVAFPTFFCVALRTAPDLLHALLWWVVCIGGISITPLLFIRRAVRRGDISDHHVSVREQRFVPLLVGLGSVSVAFLLLLALHASIALIATVIAVIVVLALSTVITRYLKWKISLHLVGLAGAVTVFVLVFGSPFLFLSPLVVLVGWARWRVRAHSPLQAVAGTVLAVSVTLAIFWLFGVR